MRHKNIMIEHIIIYVKLSIESFSTQPNGVSRFKNLDKYIFCSLTLLKSLHNVIVLIELIITNIKLIINLLCIGRINNALTISRCFILL